MKILLLLFITAAAALPKAAVGSVHYTTCYSGFNKGGSFQTFSDYVPDLGLYNFDNTISSATVTGIWFYYEDEDYNLASSGSVYWLHGFDYFSNFDNSYDDVFSSLRYGGSPDCLGCDTWTVYQGQYFTGSEFYGTTDSNFFGNLQGQVSAILLTGTSAWTFYDGPSYSGRSVCLYPNTVHDVSSSGEVLNLGIYPDVTQVGMYDNSIQSVRRGCWSDVVFKAPEVHAQGQAKNGAWGYFRPEAGQEHSAAGQGHPAAGHSRPAARPQKV
ncbi:uncharacterized protein [Procambarus clarkii]|uniref:uncharacterized protein n=1 Tax=Procambarus clarkii TaxID=6728 RepID=UPI001E6720A0|nr:uncharacterized protein LOC123770829 [Procambarus clarkii]